MHWALIIGIIVGLLMPIVKELSNMRERRGY